MENFIRNFIVTLEYLDPWHFQNPRHIQNTENIYYEALCNPDIFRTLVYSELCHILKSNHIQNPAEYLRWSILLRTLYDYSRFRGPIYSKLLDIPKRCVSPTS